MTEAHTPVPVEAQPPQTELSPAEVLQARIMALEGSVDAAAFRNMQQAVKSVEGTAEASKLPAITVLGAAQREASQLKPEEKETISLFRSSREKKLQETGVVEQVANNEGRGKAPEEIEDIRFRANQLIAERLDKAEDRLPKSFAEALRSEIAALGNSPEELGAAHEASLIAKINEKLTAIEALVQEREVRDLGATAIGVGLIERARINVETKKHETQANQELSRLASVMKDEVQDGQNIMLLKKPSETPLYKELLAKYTDPVMRQALLNRIVAEQDEALTAEAISEGLRRQERQQSTTQTTALVG